MTDTATTELRQDPITGDWVIVAAGRGARPRDFVRQPVSRADSENCPFCPGNEGETPPEVWRLDGPDSRWRIRVVPNRFAVLAGSGDADPQVSPEGFCVMPGRGEHEVIVESPDHDGDLALFEANHVRNVLEAYRVRYRALAGRGAALVVIFRNHGPQAGTSLIHPHSQVIAAPLIPNAVEHRLQRAIEYFKETGRPLCADVLQRELEDGRRIVMESGRFVAFQPYASAAPYETWIMPRLPRPSFGGVPDEDLDDLAPVLRSVLAGLRRAMDDPDYNMVIHSTPAAYVDREYLGWYIQIIPRLTTPAGFELGTGIRVNPTVPEEAAALLRQAIQDGI